MEFLAPEGTPAERLSHVLVDDDPTDGLWELIDEGWADEHLPELPALRLEQDPVHRHKDVLTHTVAVTAQAPARLRVRLAALFHDIGKPRTRRIDHEGVTFRHHEAVGSKMTRVPCWIMLVGGLQIQVTSTSTSVSYTHLRAHET